MNVEAQVGVDDSGPALARTHLGTWLAAGVGFAIGIGAVIVATRLGIGPVGSPKPGNWPLIIGIGIAAMSVALAVLAPRMSTPETFNAGSLKVAAAVVTLVLFAVCIGLIGFEIPCFAILAIWMKLFGRESWKTTITVSLATTVAFYLLFVLALSVPLPHLISIG